MNEQIKQLLPDYIYFGNSYEEYEKNQDNKN